MKKKLEFSKVLIRQEAILIWIMSLSFIALAFYCIHEGFTGSLPWLAAMVGFPWTAYGVSQAMYYSKSKCENTSGGIKYDTAIIEAQRIASVYQNAASLDFTQFADGVDPTAQARTANSSLEIIEDVDDYQI